MLPWSLRQQTLFGTVSVPVERYQGTAPPALVPYCSMHVLVEILRVGVATYFIGTDTGVDPNPDTAGGNTISVNRVPEADPDYNADACTGKLKSRGLSEKIKAAFSVVKNAKSKGEKSVKSMTAPKEKKSKQSTAKKINVQAHTNYRSLKLRNKENRRGGGRFSRRR
jgi:hypothetical protein